VNTVSDNVLRYIHWPIYPCKNSSWATPPTT